MSDKEDELESFIYDLNSCRLKKKKRFKTCVFQQKIQNMIDI